VLPAKCRALTSAFIPN